jgi:hypothetical protein
MKYSLQLSFLIQASPMDELMEAFASTSSSTHTTLNRPTHSKQHSGMFWDHSHDDAVIEGGEEEHDTILTSVPTAPISVPDHAPELLNSSTGISDALSIPPKSLAVRL